MMRHLILLASLVGITALGLGLAGPAYGDNFSLGVQSTNLNLGITIGPMPPPLVVVPAPVVVAPGPPPPVVYIAPSLPYNYFVYQNSSYLDYEDHWFRGRHYNGPWTVLSIAQVPRPVLPVPVEQYRERPPHWKHHGPPPWAHERHEARGHGRGHAKGWD